MRVSFRPHYRLKLTQARSGPGRSNAARIHLAGRRLATWIREAILIVGFVFSAVLLGTVLFILLVGSYATLMVLTGHP